MAKAKTKEPEKKTEIKKEEGKEEIKKEPASPSDDKFSTLENKIEELNKAQQGYKEFIDGASIVINTIAGDPNLTKAFQDRLKQPAQQSEPQPTQTNQQPSQPTPDQRIAGVEASQRENVVKNFEKEYGIEGLKEEDKKEARKKIANYLADFGWTINSVPLQNLGKTLDRAYVGTHAEKLREEGKLEGFVQARGTASATMPTMGGGTPAPGETKGLTSAQKEWVKKLGVDEERATKAYLAQDEEKTRVSPQEEKK